MYFPSVSLTLILVTPQQPSVRERREGLGFGLNRFAAKIGLSSSHLSRIERGLRGAQPEVKKRIARGLGTTISAIRWETEGNK